MTEIRVTQSFSDAWHAAVKAGKVITEFDPLKEDTAFDLGKDRPPIRLPAGTRIKFGLRLTTDVRHPECGRPEYYVENLTEGVEIPATVEEKVLGSSRFLVQLNLYRSLRPGGSIKPLVPGPKEYASPGRDECRFWCDDSKDPLTHNNSMLLRDPIMQIALPAYKWNAYHNQGLFEKEGHILWIPVETVKNATRIPHFEQQITEAFLEDMLYLFRNSRGMLVFFNALHAGATVDHIHFQAVAHKQKLAIEAASVVNYRGSSILGGYPANGFVFDRNEAASRIFSYVDRLQRSQTPFNLILLGKRICLLPRNKAHEVVKAFPYSVLASMELAGKGITDNREVYDKMSEEQIRSALGDTTLEPDEMIGKLG